jgi:hypothetical protein
VAALAADVIDKFGGNYGEYLRSAAGNRAAGNRAAGKT